ncbi:MAG: Hsp20/alpha crystallin family protein [Deltaproteobacteria bacterium]|jgi:HSP20 family protein|nr:MAG: Hsp20/alpha crystallin family protein [Deltaproteobacteria bacterium]
MELVRFEPFAGFGNLRSVFNGLFDENLGRSSTQPSVSKWYPAVDVLESKDSYLIRAELPGMKREDIKVEVKDGTLVLSGERKSEKPADGVEYRHVERVTAKFWRSFSLPETVKQDGIEATYKDGILEIRVPKAEEAKPRQIEISVH